MDFLLFPTGLLCLYLGAEGMVSGSSRLALSLGIRPAVVGLTIIAFGTSSPEAVVSVLGVLRGSQGIALGNVIGSNIANIGLVLALSALIRPIRMEPSLIRREIPLMLGVSVLLYLLSIDGSLGRIDGLLLFLGIVGFIYYQVRKAREVAPVIAAGASARRWRNILLTVAGLALLLLGAYLLVESGANIARRIGISEFVIGLTIIAVGTSLPELATSLVAAARGKGEISAGNVVGSNIFNILGVLGIAAMLMPLEIGERVLRVEYPIMIGVSLLVVPFLRRGVFTRVGGLVALLAYLAFIGRLL